MAHLCIATYGFHHKLQCDTYSKFEIFTQCSLHITKLCGQMNGIMLMCIDEEQRYDYVNRMYKFEFEILITMYQPKTSIGKKENSSNTIELQYSVSHAYHSKSAQVIMGKTISNIERMLGNCMQSFI